MPRRNKRSCSDIQGDITYDLLSVASPSHAAMIGCSCPQGLGGRDCPCCGDAPGKPRSAARRHAKRSERQKLRKQLKMGGHYRNIREYYEYEYAE